MRSEKRSLPYPIRERWQPLRSGFVNLYRYDREEFHYENGRLLLRGNNGTGKTRVLALQLPFLLDGEVNPQRLEPDGDPSKRIEWNLLMDRYPDRTGYTWIEFGRSEQDGEKSSKEHYLTLGCGLNAVEGKLGVRQWFFITTQRIGRDIELVSDSKQVIGKERLREKIGSNGEVLESVGAYRRAVNEALFHFDEYRYASLLNLLIQLRSPQLTRRFEEQELSRALSEAMAPVSPLIVASVADAFSNLQSDRAELASSKSALAAVERFLGGYRSYAQIAAKRTAERVLKAHYEYEEGMKEVLTAEAECDRFLAELARLKAEMQRLGDEEHALEAEISAFQQNPQIRDARGLEQASREANERRRDAGWAASELTDASDARKDYADEHILITARLEQCQLRLAAATEAAAHAASAAGLEDIHREWSASEKIEGAIQTQIEKLETAGRLNERVSVARGEVQRVTAGRDQLAGLLSDVREHLNAARAEHQSSITTFLGAVSDWTASLTELPLPFDEAFLRSVSEWCDRPHGPNPFALASRKALDELTKDFAERRACLEQLERTHDEESEAEAGDLDAVLDSIDELNRREDILRGEAAAAPADDAVRSAHEYAIAVARHMDSLRSRLAEAEEHLKEKERLAHQIAAQRDRDVADLGIAKWVDDLESLRDGIMQYRVALGSLPAAVKSFEETKEATERVWMHLEQAMAREERHKERASALERQAIAAEVARDAAAQSAGADFPEILDRVDQARRRID